MSKSDSILARTAGSFTPFGEVKTMSVVSPARAGKRVFSRLKAETESECPPLKLSL